MKYVAFMSLWPSTINILISNWPQTRKLSQLFKNASREKMIFTFLTIVKRWSRFTSNFYALIGQNLTGEFMRKIYAASCNLFTLTTEADRVFCQLLMFLLDVQNEIQLPPVIHGWFVYWLRKAPLIKVGNPVSDGIVFNFHLAGYVREL